jgi:hypothetical protein
MGDRVQIPRSFSDRIGVADVQNSLRRHYVPNFWTGELTTGVIWPGPNVIGQVHTTTIEGTNGIAFFQRNAVVERVHCAAYTQTTSSGTTQHQIDIMGGGTTIARIQQRFWNETSMVQISMSTTPLNANVVAGTAVRIQCVRKINCAKSVSIAMSFRDRLDG